MDKPKPTILDVASGNAPIKFQVSLDTKTMVILAVSVFFAIVVGVIIANKVS